MRRWLIMLGCVVLLAGCAGRGVSVPSLEKADIPEVPGRLVVPEGRGPFPAVVLIHGCSGVRPNADMWAGFFRENGYATLILDGFGARGVNEICTNFNRVPTFRRVMDSYAALRYLASLPEIAADRVALMGFSNGAVVVLDASTAYWNEFLTNPPLRFRAALAFYPECRNRIAEFPLPVSIHIGDRDDWTLSSSCEALVEQAKSSGVPPQLHVYQGGLHGFDDLRGGGYLPQVRNMNSATGYGASVGGDARSLERSKADVLMFLGRHLRAD